MYRTIESSFWTDEKVKVLPAEAKLLLLYFITNPAAHVGGIYIVQPILVALQTGIRASKLDTLYDTLSGAGLCRFDQKLDVVWVVNMARYQARGEKAQRAAAMQLRALHNSILIKEFLSIYPDVAKYPIDGASGARIKEQEQEQEQNPPNPPSGGSPDSAKTDSPKPGQKPRQRRAKAVDPISWTADNGWAEITDVDRAQWAEAYPACNLKRQLAAMAAWLKANPAKAHKTAWRRFITNWLAREQNRGGDAASSPVSRQEAEALHRKATFDETLKRVMEKRAHGRTPSQTSTPTDPRPVPDVATDGGGSRRVVVPADPEGFGESPGCDPADVAPAELLAADAGELPGDV